MPSIKFSDYYEKFPSIYDRMPPAELLQVFVTEKAQLSKQFITYDTKKRNGGYYELPEGKLIVLLFRFTFPKTDFVFTTVRSWNEEKERYYRSLQGKFLHIKFVDHKGEPRGRRKVSS